MKKFLFLLIILCCIGLSSCDKKVSAIEDLKEFSENLSSNSEHYNKEEWEDAFLQFESIVEELDKYEYTDEELQEIGRLKARCFKQMSKGRIKSLKEEIHSFGQQLKGALEEFNETLDK